MTTTLALLNPTSFVKSSGYVAIFILSVLQSCCIPTSSELTLGFGGVLASQGTLSLPGVIAAGTVGELVGAYIAWVVGRAGGRPLVERYGRYILLSPHDLDRAEAWYHRTGRGASFGSRLLPVIRNFVALPAGVAEVPALQLRDPDRDRLAHLGRGHGPHRIRGRQAVEVGHARLQRRRLRPRRAGRARRRLRDLAPVALLPPRHPRRAALRRGRRPPGRPGRPGRPGGVHRAAAPGARRSSSSGRPAAPTAPTPRGGPPASGRPGARPAGSRSGAPPPTANADAARPSAAPLGRRRRPPWWGGLPRASFGGAGRGPVAPSRPAATGSGPDPARRLPRPDLGRHPVVRRRAGLPGPVAPQRSRGRVTSLCGSPAEPGPASSGPGRRDPEPGARTSTRCGRVDRPGASPIRWRPVGRPPWRAGWPTGRPGTSPPGWGGRVRTGPAGAPIAAMADQLGLGARQLHRRCLPLFGYGPKHLARSSGWVAP